MNFWKFCTLRVKGQKAEFELNTGAPYTMISEETMKTVGEQMSEAKVTVKSFIGYSVKSVARLGCTIPKPSEESKDVSNKLQPDLIGRDLILEHDIITVNHIQDEVKALRVKDSVRVTQTCLTAN